MTTKMITLLAMVSMTLYGVNAFGEDVPGQSTGPDVPATAGAIHPLAIGATIPSLVLESADGNRFDLNDAIEKRPSVIIFYRGGWCPYCNLQLGQLQAIEPNLLEMGYQILAISPDRPEKLVDRVNKHRLTYTLLSDHTMTAAKSFGVAFRVDDKTLTKYQGYGIDLEAASGQTHHLLPVPSVFIVETDSMINFSYTNPDYKVRLAPDELLNAAKAVVSETAKKNDVIEPAPTHYDRVLTKFVKDGLVNYAALKKKSETLHPYLKQLSLVTKEEFESWDENRQLAYLINLYNATTLELIIDNYPVKSIKHIGGLFKGPWGQPVVRLFGDTITLNTLEHQIIRKDYDEPRIHIALVCAAMGCPPLRSEAYTGEKLDQQLDNQSKVFLNSPRGLQIDRQKRTVSLSSIFKWYGKDFVNKYTPNSGYAGFSKTERAVLYFCSRYLSEADRKYLAEGGYSVNYLDYDWSLNEGQMKK
jgi:peroxiredoxin